MNPFGEYAALRRFTRNLHQSPVIGIIVLNGARRILKLT